MKKMTNITRRLDKAEKQLGINQNEDYVEYTFPDGRIVRSTRKEYDDFIAWLENRCIDYNKAIETT